jgi:hypothetical protein
MTIRTGPTRKVMRGMLRTASGVYVSAPETMPATIHPVRKRPTGMAALVIT